MSTAEQQARWRRRRAEAEGRAFPAKPGPKPVKPCGTTAAYKRHQRAGEQPCDACRAAWADWQRDNYQRRKGQ